MITTETGGGKFRIRIISDSFCFLYHHRTFQSPSLFFNFIFNFVWLYHSICPLYCGCSMMSWEPSQSQSNKTLSSWPWIPNCVLIAAKFLWHTICSATVMAPWTGMAYICLFGKIVGNNPPGRGGGNWDVHSDSWPPTMYFLGVRALQFRGFFFFFFFI